MEQAKLVKIQRICYTCTCMLLYMWDSKTVPKKQNCFQNCTFYSVVDWLHAADFKSGDLWFKSYHLPTVWPEFLQVIIIGDRASLSTLAK